MNYILQILLRSSVLCFLIGKLFIGSLTGEGCLHRLLIQNPGIEQGGLWEGFYCVWD